MSPECWGFRRKSNELACYIYSDLSHLLCLTKHHLKETELDHTYEKKTQ